ncbi:MAG: rubredoxin-like domain-containing protein [Thermodesulfobacteriota bacterium]
MMNEQYVCQTCGYNMVGYAPDFCPFCGAPREKFISAADCSRRFEVIATPVSAGVARLNSVPPLGLEHAAYQIDTGKDIIWIDCPSTFAQKILPPTTITFTHHHFLGAVNLYRDFFGCKVRINRADATFELCRGFTFDELFEGRHDLAGIKAFHIDGHTPGFTFYLFKETLFVCDYVFFHRDRLKFNPFGPADETAIGGRKLHDIIAGLNISKVCGYNYVSEMAEWLPAFNALLNK